MGRLRSKKFSAHGKAAKSATANVKPSQTASTSASGRASAVAEAAVKAAFDENDDDEELLPVGDHEASGDDDDDKLGNLSRGQRKRMKRRSAFLRKMGLVQRVVQEKESAKKKQEQGAFAEIQELQDALFLSDKELAASSASKISQSTNAAPTATATLKPKKLSGKQRQKLAVRELGQLKAVHTHPQFQNDPFAAIQLHLQNTVVQANAATLQKQAASATKAKGVAKTSNAMDME